MNKSVYKLLGGGVLAAAGIALDVETLRAVESCTSAKQDCEMNDGHEFHFLSCGPSNATYGCFPEWPGEPEYQDTCEQDEMTFCK